MVSYLVLWKLGVLATPNYSQVVRLAKHFRHPDACIEIFGCKWRQLEQVLSYLVHYRLWNTDRLPLKTLSSQGLALYTVRIFHQPRPHSFMV